VTAEAANQREPRRGPVAGPGGATVVAAVDWGGTWIRVALATADGQLLGQSRTPRPAGLAEQCDLVCAEMAWLGASLNLLPAAVGVGIAGIARGGRVESAVNIGIKQPVDLARRLQHGTGLPVLVVNDTQAAAIAEAGQLGPGTHVLLTVGTGVGGAIVKDGRLVSGRGAAGDFGHMIVAVDGPRCRCGARGCLEQLVSGRVLNLAADQLARTGASPWLAARAADRGQVHAGDLDVAAQAGDRPATAALERAASALVAGLRSIAAAIDPDNVVLGGGLLSPGSLLTRLVHQRWPMERPRWSAAELRPALLGAEAGLRGAALLATAAAD
jgi:glucokinase